MGVEIEIKLYCVSTLWRICIIRRLERAWLCILMVTSDPVFEGSLYLLRQGLGRGRVVPDIKPHRKLLPCALPSVGYKSVSPDNQMVKS